MLLLLWFWTILFEQGRCWGGKWTHNFKDLVAGWVSTKLSRLRIFSFTLFATSRSSTLHPLLALTTFIFSYWNCATIENIFYNFKGPNYIWFNCHLSRLLFLCLCFEFLTNWYKFDTVCLFVLQINSCLCFNLLRLITRLNLLVNL